MHMTICTHQTETASVWKQFDVRSATVDTILKIHLISATRSQKDIILHVIELLKCR